MLQERDEKTCLKALELLNPDLYASNCSLLEKTALHYAASLGYTAFVKEVLARGYSGLINEEGGVSFLEEDYELSLRPAAIAVGTANFATATHLLQSMEQK